MSADFRPATPADVPGLVELINLAYQKESFFIRGTRTHEAEVAGLVARDVFLVRDGPLGIEGCVHVQANGDRGYFGMLSVHPNSQGAGLGRELVAAAEARALAHGCEWMDLTVAHLRLELPPWYRRLGYEAVGTAPFSDPARLLEPCHFIVMSKRIGSAAPARAHAAKQESP